jgi:GTP-binding protein
MNFIDHAKIYVKAGDGGRGHVSFRREKGVPKGGPDGGSGGNGGNVIFQTDPQLSTLLDFHYKRVYKAKDGGPGEKYNCTGRSAEDLIIKVPCGTLIKEILTDDLVADLVEPYESAIVARSGRGGRGNSEFCTPTNQAPRYADEGTPGQELEVKLELKLIADVGLVGFPNAGKSTLISVISAAKPKIADYPFTTLIPNLGIVQIGDHMNYTVADIPGLIEGASDGKGLGIQFLRHVERTKLLIFLLDATSEDVKSDFKILKNELKKFNPKILKKQIIICISKVDCLDPTQYKKLMKTKFTTDKIEPMMISAVANMNIQELKMKVWNLISQPKVS